MPLQTHDKAGREYLRLDQVIDGQLVELGDGFSCRQKGKAMIFKADGEFYFFCEDGRHLLTVMMVVCIASAFIRRLTNINEQ